MSKILRPLYLSLEILGGHIGLPLLLIAFQFVKHKRSPVVFHFCVTWIIFSVAGSMTVYGPTPLEALTSQGLCLLTQAADDGATIMTSLATLSLLLNLYFCLIQPSWYVDRQWRKRVELTLAYTPYVGFFIFFFQTYAWSAPISGQPGKSTFSDNFCNFTGIIWVPSYFLAIGILGIATLLDGLILVSLFQSRTRPAEERRQLRDIIVRMSLFSAYRAVYLVIYVIMSIGSGGKIAGFSEQSLEVMGITVQYVQAASPLIAFLVLGTKSDVLAVWGIRLPNRWRTHYAVCQKAMESGMKSVCTCDEVDESDLESGSFDHTRQRQTNPETSWPSRGTVVVPDWAPSRAQSRHSEMSVVDIH